LIGDSKVGKTALVHRFINNKFNEGYRATQCEKFTTSAVVDNRRVKFTIWDTSGSQSSSSSKSLAYREADVFLLCYKISDPSTLFSALNYWCPEIRHHSSYSVPIILVGCGSDLRTDRDVLSSLSRRGKAPVSIDQALSFCQRIGGVTYVETSAKSSGRAAISAFEVAGLASMGKLEPSKTSNVVDVDRLNTQATPNMNKHQQYPRTNLQAVQNRNSVGTESPDNSLERKNGAHLPGFRGDIYAIEPAEQFWEQFNNSLIPSPKISRSISAPRTPSLGSAG
jgi:small GTP-binding protein